MSLLHIDISYHYYGKVHLTLLLDLAKKPRDNAKPTKHTLILENMQVRQKKSRLDEER